MIFSVFFFFFNDTATTEIYTLSLHDALPIFVDAFLDAAVELAGHRAADDPLLEHDPRARWPGFGVHDHDGVLTVPAGLLDVPARDPGAARQGLDHGHADRHGADSD